MKGAALLLCAACATTPPAPPQRDFRETPPPPTPAAAFHAPVPEAFALKNGLRVFFVERHEVPLVAIDLAIDSGVDTNPRGKAGLASFALDLIDEGTASRDAYGVARDLEDLAVRFRVQPDADASDVGMTVLSSALAPALNVFADVVLHPAFREADLERVRQQRLSEIAQTLDDPAAVGQRVLQRVIFGDQHPWAFPSEGTAKSIKALTRADVVAWHAGAFQPRNAALFVVGDVTKAGLVTLLEKELGDWHDTGAPAPHKREPPKSQKRVVYVVDKPDAPQSQIWIGELGLPSTAPDVFAVRVMNNILGGSFNSRLNGNLRTEHAWSYGVFSFFDTHRESGAFVASAGVVADKTAEALAEFVKELNRMKSGAVTDTELADAKQGLIEGLPAYFASNEATAGAFARAWSHDLPREYYAQYQERIQAVTKDDVAKAARERLHPDAMQIVVVGPRQQIAEKLSALKLGSVELRDADGEAAKALEKK